MMDIALENLQKRNNSLKSRLMHDQLKWGSYSFKNFRRESLKILEAYKHHKSIFKAVSNFGINYNLAIKWFIQGQLGNPQFRDFYCGIYSINNYNEDVSFDYHSVTEEIVPQVNELEGDYKISQYGTGWSYTTYVEGEKIFIISNELDALKKKVLDKNLPLK
ncbi:hypothetical protein [Methanobrevibacter sp.]|uniref:hypothetical protein n=1 Tax=Methanobrevibacter sp. TaxID=66852 RepID=UPI00388CF344